MKAQQNLAQLLRDTLEKRCERNARYSLRAFARDLEVPAPRLSRWLNSQEGLSRTSATKLAARLGLSKKESEVFILSMESQFARAKTVRDSAKKKLAQKENEYTSLDVDAFKVIADWYHLAILSLLETENCPREPDVIARRLGISIHQVNGALRRLEELEMIEEGENQYSPTGVFFANPAGIPSKSIRSFHHQILEKAKTALELQAPEERDFSSLVIAVDDQRIPEAKAFIKEFRDEFEKRFCPKDSPKSEVYSLGLQFFRLTEKPTSTPSQPKGKNHAE